MRSRFSLPAHLSCVIVLFASSAPTLMAQNPVPFLSQPVVPDAIAPGVPTATLRLVVNGTGFVPLSRVNWNGSPRKTTYVNNSRLIAQLLPSDIVVPTSAWITVVNPPPGGGRSNTLNLPIHNPISSLSFSQKTYTVGGNPQYAEAADFRGKGKLDLAIANDGTGMVSILLGNGDGTFESAADYYAGPCAQLPIIGDFNRDGKPDIAVPNCDGVAVLLGNGDGTFKSAVSYPIGGTPIQGITADLNGDGKLDLAIGGWFSGVSILLGNGDGTFQPYHIYSAGSVQTGVQAGDFNRDGKLDLAVANWGSNTVSILLGNGDGTFRPAVDYATGNSPG
ncbi:MAG: VCBS repeat-containing protein, partial [Candidatus Korobacteraceae bacterium]